MDRETQSRHVPPRFVRRVRRAALLISSGLGIQAASLPWAHPLAFLSITMLGTALVVAGVSSYLWAEARR